MKEKREMDKSRIDAKIDGCIAKIDNTIYRLMADGKGRNNIESLLIAKELREIRSEVIKTFAEIQNENELFKETEPRKQGGYVAPSSNIEDLDRGFTREQRGL